MSAASLRRRLAKIAADAFCPNCGCNLAGTRQPQQRNAEFQRFLADATDEELAQIDRAVKSIQTRHNAECDKRGDTPVVIYAVETEESL